MRRATVKSCRRRCCECRRWYTPDPRARRSQKTCSQTCRLRRRARQKKARRVANLQRARETERLRQQRHRASKRLKTQEKARVSRPGMSAEAVEIIEIILAKLEQDQRLSRPGIQRLLRGFLGSNAAGSTRAVAKGGP